MGRFVLLRTGDLRRQHDVALSMVDAIKASIEEMGEEPSLSGVFGLTISLAKLSGTLRIHFAQEDRHLYRSEEHTSELHTNAHLVCRLLLEKKNDNTNQNKP